MGPFSIVEAALERRSCLLAGRTTGERGEPYNAKDTLQPGKPLLSDT